MLIVEYEYGDGTSQSFRFEDRESFETFEERLKQIMGYPRWFGLHKMDYVNANKKEVRPVLYAEMFPSSEGRFGVLNKAWD